MTPSNTRQALLSAEPPDPVLAARFRARLSELTERRMGTGERAGLSVVIAAGFGAGAWIVRLLVVPPAAAPPDGWIAGVAGLVLLAVILVQGILQVRRGVVDLTRGAGLRAGLVGSCALVMVLLVEWQGRHAANAAEGGRTMLVGLVVWNLAVLPYCIAHFVRTSELKLRHELLRIELAIAERGERHAS